MNSICNLFDINEFNRFCIQESTSFSVLHLNKRSVLGNIFDELSLNLNENKAKFRVIFLNETCFLPNKNPPILEGYTSYAVSRNCNRNNRGGSLLVSVRDKLSSIKVRSYQTLFLVLSPLPI